MSVILKQETQTIINILLIIRIRRILYYICTRVLGVMIKALARGATKRPPIKKLHRSRGSRSSWKEQRLSKPQIESRIRERPKQINPSMSIAKSSISFIVVAGTVGIAGGTIVANYLSEDRSKRASTSADILRATTQASPPGALISPVWTVGPAFWIRETRAPTVSGRT